MGGGDFEVLGRMAAFVGAVWGAGRALRAVGMSPVVGEIVVGMLLGPALADFVPLVSLGPPPGGADPGGGGGTGRGMLAAGGGAGPAATSLWVYLGQVGVTLLIAESGMHMDFGTIRRVGLGALGVAVLGTLLPLGLGIGVVYALGWPAYPDGLAAGCALAPTSIGIALKLLSEQRQLNTELGQTIVTAAFVDDVFSLVSLAILLDLAGGSLTAWGVAQPVVFSVLFIGVGSALAFFVFPFAVPWLTSATSLPCRWIAPCRWGGGAGGPGSTPRGATLVPAKAPGAPGLDIRDEFLLLLMLALICVYSYVASLIGSHLLGAFVAGMSFCRVPRAMPVWQNQMKRLNAWLIRLFFACTVGFSIPIDQMISWGSFWKGMVIAVAATCFGKVISGVFVGRHRWVVGMAMMGRGEFAYLVAQTALITPFKSFSAPAGAGEAGEAPAGATMLSPNAYTSVVWALLTATVMTPFLFKLLLSRMARLEQGAPGELGGDAALVKKWKIRIAHDLLPAEEMTPVGEKTSRSPRLPAAAPPAPPPPQNLMRALAAEGLDITAFEIISGGLLHSYNEVYTVEVPDDRVDKALRADVEAIEEKMHRIVTNTMQADQRYNLLIKPIRPGELSRDCSLAIRPSALPEGGSPPPLGGGGAGGAGGGTHGVGGALTEALAKMARSASGTQLLPRGGGAGCADLPRAGSTFDSKNFSGGGGGSPGPTPPQNLKLQNIHFGDDPEYYGQLVSQLVETSMSNSRGSRLADLADEEAKPNETEAADGPPSEGDGDGGGGGFLGRAFRRKKEKRGKKGGNE